jgi:hypothetical protein
MQSFYYLAIIRVLCYVLFPFLLVTCQKQEDPAARPFPSVRTLAVEETTDATLFTGEIFYSDGKAITDHGFEFFTLREPSTCFSAVYTKSMGAKSGPGTFTVSITNNLQKGAKYSVRA